MIFLGNPFSGVTSAPELLPAPADWLGRLLPPGAGGTLLRSTAYFDGTRRARRRSACCSPGPLPGVAAIVAGHRAAARRATSTRDAGRHAVPRAGGLSHARRVARRRGRGRGRVDDGFARLNRFALRASGVPVRLRDATATVFAGNALSVTLPGGALASLAYTARRLRALGASASLTAFSLAATGLLSAVALALLAAERRPARRPRRPRVLARSASAGCWPSARRCSGWCGTRAPSAARPTPCSTGSRDTWRTAAGVRRGVDTVLDELAEVRLPRRVWVAGLRFALANWAADLVCLLAACLAAGVHPDLVTTVLAYTAGMAAASAVPLLPGGIGAVEAALILALRHGGAALHAATAAVVGYRVISLGLVAGAGLGRATRPAPAPRARAAAGSASAMRPRAASSIAALTNHASNALGGRYTPASSIAWKNDLVAERLGGLGPGEVVHRRRRRRTPTADCRRTAPGARTPASVSAAPASSPISARVAVEREVHLGPGVAQRRQPRGHGDRVPRQRPGLVHRPGRGERRHHLGPAAERRRRQPAAHDLAECEQVRVHRIEPVPARRADRGSPSSPRPRRATRRTAR